jgi:hypothetical protein
VSAFGKIVAAEKLVAVLFCDTWDQPASTFGDGDFGMQPEAVAKSVQQGADDEFGVGMFAAYAAHVPTAAGFGEAVFVHRFGFLV